jgi:26S proteasome regulatory subunit N5
VLFLLLSKHDNHQRDLLHRMRQLKALEQTPVHADVLKMFATDEIVPLPFVGQTDLLSALSFPRHEVSDASEEDDFFIKLLPKRVVQFNLRVIARYYSRISTSRLATLLGLSVDDLEAHLSEVQYTRNICITVIYVVYIR